MGSVVNEDAYQSTRGVRSYLAMKHPRSRKADFHVAKFTIFTRQFQKSCFAAAKAVEKEARRQTDLLYLTGYKGFMVRSQGTETSRRKQRGQGSEGGELERENDEMEPAAGKL